jgi:hypothetical protein
MIQNFTPNDILLANSGELPSELCSLLQLNLYEDDALQEFSDSLNLVESEFEKVMPMVDENLVQRIMSRLTVPEG